MANIDPDKVRQLRIERSMSQQALVRAAQGPHPVSRSTVQSIERAEGTYFATHETILALSAALGVEPDELKL